ncbi:MAG: hypothetical protein IJ325_00680 [Clostridia bacterium]|nr:hypothetical protein [Clostridia bacterium]
MFLFKNGKFHIEGLSFTIPEGFTLDTIDTAEEYQGGMKMVSPDRNIIITVLPIFCSEGSIGIELDAEGHFHDKLVNLSDTFETIIPAAPLKRKNLTGYCAAYQTEGHSYYPGKQYYEELYDISLTPNTLNFIEISVETTTDYTIQKALENPDVIRFFAGLDEE